jgi:hypothetical protein
MEDIMSSNDEALCSENCLLAHNFNNKLTIILGECELLSDHVTDDIRARLNTIRDVAKVMATELAAARSHIATLLHRDNDRDVEADVR